jgi:ABC-2 type transport system ATP-binding protein
MSEGKPIIENVIKIENLSKAYGSRKILTDLNMNVKAGETCALLGRNGTGKSTLVKILTGTLDQDQGTVEILNQNPHLCASGFIPGVSYLSETRPLFPWLNVNETLLLFKQIHARWDADEADILLKKLNLRRDSRVSSLSRGEQGKLALIGVLASGPDLLILDEPTSGLDPAVRRSFLEVILSAMVDSGKTVFYVTHDLYEAQRLAGKVMFLDSGKIAITGEVEELRGSHRKISGKIDQSKPLPPLQGAMNWSRENDNVTFDFTEWNSESENIIKSSGIEIKSVFTLDLEDIFCVHFGDHGANQEEQ